MTPRFGTRIALSFVALSVVACGDDGGSGGGTTTSATTATTTGASTMANATTSVATSSAIATSSASGMPQGDFVVGGARPATVKVPPGFDPAVPRPLVVLLHGYTINGAVQDTLFRLSGEAAARDMLFVAPDGTTDQSGKRFWNATDACCDLFGAGVDDSAYLVGLIDEIAATVTVDPKRVFLVGHSNGGFMSYRMACDHADKIAGIASLAGATFADAAACTPAAPVSVLQIHGTMDDTIAYTGGSIGPNAYPSAEATVSTWATYDGCDTTPDTTGAPHDIDGNIAGSETTSIAYGGCMGGGRAELWTIPDGGHVPSLTPTFAAQVLDFLEAHPKP